MMLKLYRHLFNLFLFFVFILWAPSKLRADSSQNFYLIEIMVDKTPALSQPGTFKGPSATLKKGLIFKSERRSGNFYSIVKEDSAVPLWVEQKNIQPAAGTIENLINLGLVDVEARVKNEVIPFLNPSSDSIRNLSAHLVADDLVTIIAQKGAFYKIKNSTENLGWVVLTDLKNMKIQKRVTLKRSQQLQPVFPSEYDLSKTFAFEGQCINGELVVIDSRIAIPFYMSHYVSKDDADDGQLVYNLNIVAKVIEEPTVKQWTYQVLLGDGQVIDVLQGTGKVPAELNFKIKDRDKIKGRLRVLFADDMVFEEAFRLLEIDESLNVDNIVQNTQCQYLQIPSRHTEREKIFVSLQYRFLTVVTEIPQKLDVVYQEGSKLLNLVVPKQDVEMGKVNTNISSSNQLTVDGDVLKQKQVAPPLISSFGIGVAAALIEQENFYQIPSFSAKVAYRFNEWGSIQFSHRSFQSNLLPRFPNSAWFFNRVELMLHLKKGDVWNFNLAAGIAASTMSHQSSTLLNTNSGSIFVSDTILATRANLIIKTSDQQYFDGFLAPMLSFNKGTLSFSYNVGLSWNRNLWDYFYYGMGLEHFSLSASQTITPLFLRLTTGFEN